MKINSNSIRLIWLNLKGGVIFSESGFVQNLFDSKIYNLIDSKGEKKFDRDQFKICSIWFHSNTNSAQNSFHSLNSVWKF